MAEAHGALPWLGVLALALLLLLALVYWPLRLDVSARAKGEANGHFAVAGGMSLSFVSLTFVWARGLRPQLNLLLFGQKWRFRPRWRPRRRAAPEPAERAPSEAWGRVDPVKLLLKLVSERRHFRLRYLVLDLAYGFRDPLLTGRLVGAISALSGLLPPPIEIRQRPRWDFEDGWEVAFDGRAFVKPWLVLLEMAAYVVRQLAGAGAPSPTRREGLGRKDHDRREQEPPTRKTGEAGAG